QAKTHIAQTDVCESAGQLGLDAPDRIERFQRAVPQFLLTCGHGEDQWVEQQIRRRNAVFPRANVENPSGYLEFPGGRGRLALFVDRERDQGRAVAPRQWHDVVDLLSSFFQVDRVDDRLAGDPLQRRLDDRGFGR